MNPLTCTLYHSSGSGIFCGFDECPRLFLGCKEIENSLSFLTWDDREGTCRPYPVQLAGCRAAGKKNGPLKRMKTWL